MTAAHAAAAWVAILGLAILNGAFREAVLIPALGVTRGTATSGVLLMAAVFGVAWVLTSVRVAPSHRFLWRVGTGWLAATLVFELAFGALVQRKAWTEMLAAYAFKNGNLWPLVLAAVLISPYVCGRVARPRGDEGDKP